MLLKLDKDGILAVATDGHRLAKATAMATVKKKAEIVLPSSAIRLLHSVKADKDAEVEIRIESEKQLAFIQQAAGIKLEGRHEFTVASGRIDSVYSRVIIEYKNPRSAGYAEGDMRAEQAGRVTESAVFLTENFHRVPLMLIPCITGRLDNAPVFAAASAWGSLLPAVWSFMLAARERGLGSAWTTIHLMYDGEQKAAEILGIPFGEITQAGLFPIAYTIGTDFKLAQRLPLDPMLHWDTW